MVDFGEMKDKATDAVAGNADKIKDGIDKAGDFVADKIGHKDKVEKAEDAVTSLVDKLAGDK